MAPNTDHLSHSPPRGPKRARDERDHPYNCRGRNGRFEDPRRLRTYDDLDSSAGNSNGRHGGQRDYRDNRNGRDDRSGRYGGRNGHGNGNSHSYGHPYGYADRRRRRSRSPPSGPISDYYNGGRNDGFRRPNGSDPHSRKTTDSFVSAAKNDDSTSAQADSHSREKQVAFELQNGDVVMTTQEPPEKDIREPAIIDEEAEIERRKRRRAELLAKLNAPVPKLAASPDASAPESGHATSVTSNPDQMAVDSPNTGSFTSPSTPPFIGDVDLFSRAGAANLKAVHSEDRSAADYDPMADKEADDRRRCLREQQQQQAAVQEEIKQAARTEDKDDEDDDDDMFAEDFDVEKAVSKDSGIDGAGGLLEDVDKEGYYKIRVGDVLVGRYQLQSTLGKGMFSGVARAVDLSTKETVAIKIIRNNDALRKGGFTEVSILQKLNQSDPDNKKHIIKFIRSFEHRGHLCMVFENLSLNLREVLRKFGNNVGINLQAVRAYAYQMFLALAHMQSCSIIHADLKPDNILVNEKRNVLKICDLGTAIDRSDAANSHDEIAPYLVSRFYRAPEIILGIPYDYAVDVWSIGCTLYEMYTGSILFTGSSNNQMLKAIQEIRGRITQKLFKRGQLAPQFFNDRGEFVSVEEDELLGRPVVKVLPVVKVERDLRSRLMEGVEDEKEVAEVAAFVDLLEGCLALNPDRRLKAAEALKHPFFRLRR